MAEKQSPFDLRLWLEQARSAGQLKEVKGADLNLEVGAITEINAAKGGPALLFDEFPGCAPGFRVMTGAMLNARTLGLTLGFTGQYGNMELVDEVAGILRRVETDAEKYPVEEVASGPVMENQFFGEDIDLEKIPVPIWHEMDGGPFIGTGTFQIHQDPETGWTNVGTYRVQRLTKNRLGNYISPGHHGHIIRMKYWEKGEPCPVVMCFGSHPLYFLLGSSDVPAGVDELTWAGAIAGQRVPVVKGPVTGLPIPADCEIAVEGWCYPGKTMLEGPFGEFTGYYGGGQKEEPYVEVAGLYYRNQPILLGSPPSKPPNDMSYQFTVMRSAAIKEALRKAGVPAVQGVWVAEAGGGRMWVVTSIRQRYAGHATQAAMLACSCQPGALMTKYSIVVDEDIDPSNLDEVIWAISTRSDPASDIDVIRQGWSNPLDTRITAEDKARGRLSSSRAIIRAVRPYDQLKTFPPVAQASPELLRATRNKWGKLWE